MNELTVLQQFFIVVGALVVIVGGVLAVANHRKKARSGSGSGRPADKNR